jgi:hypothetical protein
VLESPPLVAACSVCGSGPPAGAAVERWDAGQPAPTGGRQGPCLGGNRPVAGWGAGGVGEGRMGAQGGEEGCPSAWAGGLASRRRGVAWSAWRVIFAIPKFFAIPKSHQLAVGLDFSPYPNPISWWWVGPSTGHQWPGRGPLGGVAAVEVER